MTFNKIAPSPLFRTAAYVFLLSGLVATQTHALSGSVMNMSGAVISRAVVFLQTDTTTRQFTDTAGVFTLAAPTGILPSVSSDATTPLYDQLFFRDGRLRFELRSSVRLGSISVFSIDGTKRFSTAPAAMNAGAHELTIPTLANGLYFTRFTFNGHVTDKQVMLTNGTGHATQGALARRAAVTAIDTLVIRRIGYVTKKVAVTSYTQTDLAVAVIQDTVSMQPPVADYSVNGPYTTVIETNVGPGNNYTIVRPVTLGANGFKHPPIIYGHGINSQVSTFTTFLSSVASHGFVIIARNVLTGGPNNAANTSAMNDGLNWILAQDTTASSIYFGKLATNRAASMGYSVGGTAAVDIGGHPSLQTVVSIHGHISSAVLNGTLLQTSGTLDTVGRPMQLQTYNNSRVQTFLGTVTSANHGYIQSANGGVQRAAIIAWLRFWLYNDQGGKHYFYGPTCTMCSPVWENPQRKFWN